MASLAFNYVMNLLARREYSEFELRHKMQEKNFTEEDIDQTIQHFQQRHWQSDKRFAESYINARSKRGYGLGRIKQELRQLKGISDDTISEVLLEIEGEIDWYALAKKVLTKKFPNYAEKQPPKAKQKIWNYMFTHGFNSDEFAYLVGNGNDVDEWEY